jgi:hypothetical protein
VLPAICKPDELPEGETPGLDSDDAGEMEPELPCICRACSNSHDASALSIAVAAAVSIFLSVSRSFWITFFTSPFRGSWKKSDT